MRFLLDQRSDARLVPYLQGKGHDLTRIAQHYPGGLPDDEVLSIALREGRILITDDRDFGDLVIRRGHPHAGVIFFRLNTTRLSDKIARLDDLLTHHADDLGQFIVVTPNSVRAR